MPGRGVTAGATTKTAPVWAGDYLDREHLVPGGAKLNAADFTADSAGKKFVPAGTVLGRTIAERDASQGYGPAADTDPAGEIFILAFDVDDAANIADAELYRPGSIVKENFLPSAPSATVLGVLRTKYVCVRGAA